MAGLQTSVRYASDGTSAVWHVPFPFASPADVGVKLIAADGRERRLTQGTDYVVSGGSVMCVVPAGCSIVIWLDAPVEAALTAARAAALANAGMAGTSAAMMGAAMTTIAGTAGMTAGTTADTALVETLTRLAESLETRTQRQADAEGEARERLTAEAEENGVSLSFEVCNTSERAGKEVVQVYVRACAPVVYRPARELKAFEKIFVKGGGCEKVSLSLGRRAFAHWSAAEDGWRVSDGAYEILVGASSEDIRLVRKVWIKQGRFSLFPL